MAYRTFLSRKPSIEVKVASSHTPSEHVVETNRELTSRPFRTTFNVSLLVPAGRASVIFPLEELSEPLCAACLIRITLLDPVMAGPASAVMVVETIGTGVPK